MLGLLVIIKYAENICFTKVYIFDNEFENVLLNDNKSLH